MRFASQLFILPPKNIHMVPPLNTGHPFKKDHVITFMTDVRPYSLKELCNLYNVHNKTLYRWMEPFSADIGSRHGRFYTVLQVEIIFIKLGVPYVIKER